MVPSFLLHWMGRDRYVDDTFVKDTRRRIFIWLITHYILLLTSTLINKSVIFLLFCRGCPVSNINRNTDESSPDYCVYSLYAYFGSQVILGSILLLFVLFWILCYCWLSQQSRSDPETQSIVRNAYLRRGSNTPDDGTHIQTIQRDRFRVIRRGSNLYWIFDSLY